MYLRGSQDTDCDCCYMYVYVCMYFACVSLEIRYARRGRHSGDIAVAAAAAAVTVVSLTFLPFLIASRVCIYLTAKIAKSAESTSS